MDRLKKGASLGPYTLVRRLAVGGMAEVWAAEDAGAPRALKVLLPHLTHDAELRTMFLDEVRIATRLLHANVVRTYGGGEEGPWLYQAMELLEGADLTHAIRGAIAAERPVPVPVALMIASACARGLDYAHGLRGEDGEPLELVHRDVSPHNVFVTKDGGVRVLDFGIARAKERLTKTAQGIIKGKLSYLAPEQAMSAALSPRTDVYALGIVLWELLAMRPLFTFANELELFAALERRIVPDVRSFAPEASGEVWELLSAMLAPQPADRPASMREVDGALKKALHGLGERPGSEVIAAWIAPLLVGRKTTRARPEDRPTVDDGPAALRTEVCPAPSEPPAEPTVLDPSPLDAGEAPTPEPSAPTAPTDLAPRPEASTGETALDLDPPARRASAGAGDTRKIALLEPTVPAPPPPARRSRGALLFLLLFILAAGGYVLLGSRG